MNTGFIIAVCVIAGGITLMILLKFILQAVKKKLFEKIKENHREEDIVLSTVGANFFGLESKGSSQLRGNGALVLTKDNISFYLAMPAREYHIPLHTISEITLPTSFKGKSVFKKLLCIHFLNPERDRMAWAIEDPEEWKRRIESL